MNYLESLAYLDSLSPTLEKPSVERIKLFLAEHGNPQNSFKSFHVGGTNGKGSTVAILDSVLRAAGFTVGRFTGPHLLRWNERFHIDGKPIDDSTFARYATEIRQLSEEFGARHPEVGRLTWFEFITVLGFFFFREAAVQIAVLEVGLGGRFDATNVVEENLLSSVITNISLDHTHILGKTEELIASEKAGIIKPGKLIVTGASGAAWQVIAERAAVNKAPLISYSSDGVVSVNLNMGPESPFRAREKELEADLHKRMEADIFVQTKKMLFGRYQEQNAALAFLALALTNLKDLTSFDSVAAVKPQDSSNLLAAAWQQGIKDVYWPGRMHRISENLIFDGAHNPGGAKALRESLDASFPGKRFVFLISCFDNKDAGGILKELARRNDRLLLCEAATRRSTFPKERLLEIAQTMGVSTTTFESISQAYHEAINSISPQEMIVATGSFATVRECMQEIGWQNVEQGRVCGKIDSSENLTLVNNRGRV